MNVDVLLYILLVVLSGVGIVCGVKLCIKKKKLPKIVQPKVQTASVIPTLEKTEENDTSFSIITTELKPFIKKEGE